MVGHPDELTHGAPAGYALASINRRG